MAVSRYSFVKEIARYKKLLESSRNFAKLKPKLFHVF